MSFQRRKMMQKIKIAKGVEVSRLCAGCMGLGGGWGRDVVLGEALMNQTRAFIDTSLELGINFFDHANIYAQTRAEEIFGRVLAERPSLRDQIVLQTKCGIRWADDPKGTPQRFDFSHDHILESVDASLKRLHTDYLDILLLHRPDVLWDGEEIARAFARLKKSGKVRHFGVSNQNRFQMEYLQNFLPDPLVANQLEMNLLHHGFAEVGISFNQDVPSYPNGWEGVVEYCRLKNVSLQAWSPLARGILSGRDLSGQNDKVLQTAKLVAEMARTRGVSAEAIVLAWLFRHPAGIVPVLGTTQPSRLRSCAEVFSVELSREEWYLMFQTARGNPMP
jgi:predicted oxidoreductase